MASISKRASYVEFKVERAADVEVGSSDEDETAVTANTITVDKKPKHRWACGLRRSSSSSTAPTPTKTEFKVSFTIHGVHSFSLRVDPNSDVETHNIPHGGETQRSVTLQDPGQQSGPTWRKLIASALAGVVPDQLMDTVAWKLHRDLASLPPSKNKGGPRRSRLQVLHVHVAVKIVTPDVVTAEALLNRVSTLVSRRADDADAAAADEDCVICLERLEVEKGSLGLEVRRMLVCSHVFHGECLLRWVLKRASCPVCWTRCLGLFLARE